MTGELSTSRRPKINPIELTVLFTGFIAATYGFGVYLFSTLLPDIQATLDVSYSRAGAMIGAAQVGFLLAALSSAFLAKKLGATKLIVLSVAICCLGLASMGFAPSALVLGVLLFILGTVAASVWVPMVEVVQNSIPGHHQAKALGLMSSGTAYGLFFNGLVIPVVVPSGGWRAMWYISAAITFIMLVWAFVRLRVESSQPQKVNQVDPTAEETAKTKLFFQPLPVVILAMMFIAGIACIPTQNYLISYLRDDLGYTLGEASKAWSAIGLIGMIGGFVMGSIADRFSVYKSLSLTLVLLALSISVFIAKLDLFVLYGAAAVFGLAFNSVFGLMPALVSANFKGQLATRIFGLGNVMLGLGSVAGNFFGGVTRDLTGSFNLIHVISLFATLVLLVLVWVAKSYSRY